MTFAGGVRPAGLAHPGFSPVLSSGSADRQEACGRFGNVHRYGGHIKLLPAAISLSSVISAWRGGFEVAAVKCGGYLQQLQIQNHTGIMYLPVTLQMDVTNFRFSSAACNFPAQTALPGNCRESRDHKPSSSRIIVSFVSNRRRERPDHPAAGVRQPIEKTRKSVARGRAGPARPPLAPEADRRQASPPAIKGSRRSGLL